MTSIKNEQNEQVIKIEQNVKIRSHRSQSVNTNDTDIKTLTDLIIDDNNKQKQIISKQNYDQVNINNKICLYECEINNKLIDNSKKIPNRVISSYYHLKAINWLITYCYKNKYSNEILWNSIGYYYTYITHQYLNKQYITHLLYVCLNLSLKLLNPQQQLTKKYLQSILSTSNDQLQYRKLEQQFLNLVSFDIYFFNNLNTIINHPKYNSQTNQILFICQILFFSSYQHAINYNWIQQIITLINQPKTKTNIKTLLQKTIPHQKYIHNTKIKYSSLFNVTELWKSIIA